MTIAKIRLGDVRHNPFRKFDEFPLIEKKVAALVNSIQETGFWDNVLGRIVVDGVEIAYGHHRIEAARRVYGDDHEIGITIRDLSDIEMLRVMGLENSEDWMNPVQHAHLVVKQARAFFDSWFDKFSTWDEFRQAANNSSLPEFGKSADCAIEKVSEWLGKASDLNERYSYLVKYGVGREVISRFTSLELPAIEKTLRILGPSEREKRQLAKMEEERRQADELIAQQREAEAQAKREQAEADRQAKEAENERKRQSAIAQRAVDDEKKKAAQEESDRQAKLREAAKAERDAADKRAKAAEKAQRESEKKAKEANQAEQQKRRAAEEQSRYDQQSTFVWEKHDHASEFRRLCLLPIYSGILSQEKQAEFAAYIKSIIPGEVTSDKIRQYFEAEVKNFIAGVRKQKEAENPLLKLQRDLETLQSRSSSVAISCHAVMKEAKALNVVGIDSVGAYDLHFKLEAMLQVVSDLYRLFGLSSKFLLHQEPELTFKESTVPLLESDV